VCIVNSAAAAAASSPVVVLCFILSHKNVYTYIYIYIVTLESKRYHSYMSLILVKDRTLVCSQVDTTTLENTILYLNESIDLTNESENKIFKIRERRKSNFERI